MVLALLVLGLAGCSGPRLMPAPNVDRHPDDQPFAKVERAFRTNEVDLLYVTDRQREPRRDGTWAYSSARSDRMVYGSARVTIGNLSSWDALVRESLNPRRRKPLPLQLRWVEERGELSNPRADAGPSLPWAGVRPPGLAAADRSVAAFQAEVRRRLVGTRRQEAFVYVHGFNNDFRWATAIAAQFWHFLPREGVPIVYSWPAGRGGVRGYTYDRESSEFTVSHFKRFLTALAGCPELERVHVIAHSRGADVVTSAVRELLLEAGGAGPSVARVAKIGNLVLVAPDLDLEVASQRVAAEMVPLAVGRFTVYVHEKDRAIGLANWLFEGIRRLGQVRVRDFTAEQRAYMLRAGRVEFIDARVKAGFPAHGYFHSNPAVSSDLLQLLRYDCPAGHALRPLAREQDLLWRITDDYLAPIAVTTEVP